MINFVLDKMIQQGIIDESDSIEYEYAIEVIFLKFIHIITIFSMAFLFNFLVPTFIFFLSFHYFRQYMGGYHSKNVIFCFFLSPIFVLLLYIFTNYIKIDFFVLDFFIILVTICMYYLNKDNNFLNNIKKGLYVIVFLSNTFLVLNYLLGMKSVLFSLLLVIFLFFMKR